MDTKVIEEKIDSLLDAVKNSREYEEYKKQEELLDQGIKPNTIRLSIGTENIDDIIQDLDEAFKAIQ